jgi:large subunit ribosomal protein L23
MGVKKDEKLLSVLLAPVISEKSTALADAARVAVFRVAKSAEKAEIAAAVEKLFEVKVARVRVARVKGKAVVTRRAHRGKRAGWKKAYVSLQEGHDINFSELQ